MRIFLILLWLLSGVLYWMLWDNQKEKCCSSTSQITSENTEKAIEGIQKKSNLIVSEGTKELKLKGDDSITSLSKKGAPLTIFFEYKNEIFRMDKRTRNLFTILPKRYKSKKTEINLVGHSGKSVNSSLELEEGLRLAAIVRDSLIRMGIPLEMIKLGSESGVNPYEDPDGKSTFLNKRVEIYF